jgi:ComF family protein
LVRYRGTGRRLLHRLKYGGCEALAPELGARLGRRVLTQSTVPPSLLVVPVPLHPWRRLRRGFNQAAAIGAALAAVLDRPQVQALRRRRRTPALYRVERRRRAAALERAFMVRRPDQVAGRPVLLVDDIRTTGATLRAAAAALREAGAARVEAAVVAR